MNINQLKNEADSLMRKIVARYNSFYSTSSPVPRIELDLMLTDLSKLYDVFKTLSLTDEDNFTKIGEPVKHEEVEKSIVQESAPVQEKLEETPIIEPEDVAEAPVAEEMTDEPEFEEELPVIQPPVKEIITEQTVTENKEPEVKVPVKDQHSTIADQFKTTVKTIGESGNEFSKPVEQRLGGQISDLKTAIGLYEKFNFINDLFAGDSLAYERTIVQLNGMINFREADNYLNGVRAHYKWDAKSESVVRFMEVLSRKFS